MENEFDLKALQESEALLNKFLKKPMVCMFPGCENETINSHVFQNKRILKPIAPNDHLYCFEPNSLFNQDQRYRYKRKGISQVLAFPGFCNLHDDQIFSFIEKSDDVDWFNPKSQFLLGYKSLCRELYMKQLAIDFQKELFDKNDIVIESGWNINFLISGLSKGIKDMNRYKMFIEMGIFHEDYSCYHFETVILPFYIELCVSSVFSVSYSEDFSNQDLAEGDFNESNIVNVFPYNGKSIVIVGFAIGFENRWANEFIKELKTQNTDLICKSLSDLILFRAEFYCMSERLFHSISQKDLTDFFEKYDDIVFQRSNSLSTHINIFKEFTPSSS